MADAKTEVKPRNYFLNERHQFAPEETGGGRAPANVVGVDWSKHGQSLKQEIVSLRALRAASIDPSAKKRAFVVATPEKEVEKVSKPKNAPETTKNHSILVSGKDAQLIERLGFDLLATTADGSALVHAPDELLEQMAHSLDHLERLGVKEKNKWAHVQTLREIPIEYKTSLDWWGRENRNALLESILDLQPFLSRSEVDAVIDAVRVRLKGDESLIKIGREFTARVWMKARLMPKTIFSLARDFQAIFSIHPPLSAIVSGASASVSTSPKAGVSNGSLNLPCVAVLDTGVPTDHVLLGQYVRGRMIGEYVDDNRVWDSHGSYVASRVVFGDVECNRGIPNGVLQASCSVYDVRLGEAAGRIVPDGLTDAIDRVVSSAPDVRVFNISFDADTDIDGLQGSYRDAWMRKIADLDNQIFSRDILIVVAAGNSEPGVLPVSPYPKNYEDQQWRLRAYPRCFNAITCGGTADRLNPDGVASEPGAPSPFSRVGPGLANSPKPDFSAHAGNGPATYTYQPGSEMGVWASNDSGLWEDVSGTSFASPLLAQDAAKTFAFLQQYCDPQTRPFACLVKACLALHAKRVELPPKLTKLADLTLGYGSVQYPEIEKPVSGRATFFWQGIIASENEQLTVELPVPGSWVRAANAPKLRLIGAWDTPVNHAAESIWACRSVSITLRPADGEKALNSKNARGSSRYTLVGKEFELPASMVNSDVCLMELKYSTSQMAPSPGGLIISPQQRIGIAFELIDESENPVSPHYFIQSLPVAESLNRLSLQSSVRQGITLKLPT